MINNYISKYILFFFLLSFLSAAVICNLYVKNHQHFSVLALSFLDGNLHLNGHALNECDLSPRDGRYYWALGPLPAVILMPFELVASVMGVFFYQGYLQIFLVFSLLVVIHRIARKVGFDSDDSGYLAFGFVFATAFLGVALMPWSWFFAQVITCLIVFLAIAEMVGRRRPFVVGSLFALALATRVTASLGLIWFVGEILASESEQRVKIKSLIIAFLPFAIVLMSLFVYNYARFENVFEQGYTSQIISSHATEARSLGVFSLSHLPRNLYYMFLASPNPVQQVSQFDSLTFPFAAANPWGMSIFITSPCLLYLFGLQYKDVTSRLLLLTVFIIAIPILLYYATGYIQFGYRYSLDFIPLLYFLLIRNYQAQGGNLTISSKITIVSSALFNIFLFVGFIIKFNN